MDWTKYHVIWRKQSGSSAESMPVGGGNIGCNVWVEHSEVLLYAQQSGWFDENNSMLKAGRLRLHFEPDPFARHFCQELIPEEGRIQITGDGLLLQICVNSRREMVQIAYTTQREFALQVQYESWRFQDREVDSRSYELFQCKEMFFYPLGNPVFHKDIMVPDTERLYFYHQNQNRDLSIEKEFRDQGLEQFYQGAFNPQKDLIFGGMLHGTNLTFAGEEKGCYQDTPYHAWCYRSAQLPGKGEVDLALSAQQPGDPESLRQKLAAALQETARETEQEAAQELAAQRTWWQRYFEKSFIRGNPEQKQYFEIMRNAELFRMMMGCNADGIWPTKFNGGLFTFDPHLGGKSPWSDDPLRYTPDFRLWGGGSHTIQNQRLLYWPMLKAGDAETMRQHFDFFMRILKLAKIRCWRYFGIAGAMFPEQVGTYGLCCGCDNEWGNRTGLPVTQIKYHFSNSLETAFLMLEYHRFTGKSIAEYMDFIYSVLQFYDLFYPENDACGKMILYPGNALETYHVVKNPIDAIAGLRAVTDGVLALPEDPARAKERERVRRLAARIPDLPLREKAGHTILSCADHPSILHNCEIPELYPVFPYGLYGIGKADLTLAQDTAHYAWEETEQLTHISWHPTGIVYARLGMLPESEAFLKKKLKSGPFRFPAFWGPGHDWTPDHNWGGSGVIQLQEMLLQTDGKALRILPCWNREIDVHFKLYAPEETAVECDYADGRIKSLKVTPENRRKDVILPDWVKI